MRITFVWWSPLYVPPVHEDDQWDGKREIE